MINVIDVPGNNENARNDNFDDDRINLLPYDGKQVILKVCVDLSFEKHLEPGSQVIIRESNASEAVDHRTCESKNFIFTCDLIKIF